MTKVWKNKVICKKRQNFICLIYLKTIAGFSNGSNKTIDNWSYEVVKEFKTRSQAYKHCKNSQHGRLALINDVITLSAFIGIVYYRFGGGKYKITPVLFHIGYL